jgi:hypothetical protein
MVSGRVRRTAAIAGGLALASGGAVIAYAQQGPPPCTPQTGNGGLSFCALDQEKGDRSVTINRAAQAGATDKLFVMNQSRSALDVTVNARQWTQAASGIAIPKRRGSLGGVSVDAQTFELAPGARRELTVTLNSVPSSGYLYGALEVIGVPTDLDKRKGVVTGYRLVNSLRYGPATAKAAITVGAAKVAGKGKARALTLAVRNTGNTLDPVSGSVKLKSALGTKNVSVQPIRILPGKSVNLALMSGNSLKAGKYTATISLTQAKQKTTATKKITVRR